MREAGIADGDLLVVDRYMKPQHRSIIVAVIDNDSARWSMKQERRTPRYTTNIDEIPVVRC
ncbi:MAG: DUF4113 domain-containing protein [Comamonas sp.]